MRDARISFVSRTPFHRELVRRVDDYFERTGKARDGGTTIVRKTVVLFALLGGSYLLFLLGGLGWLGTLLGATLAGIAIAGLGMAVMHDGSHGAYASTARGNKFSARVLDLLGGSSYVWKFKHVHVHHTYPNINGADDDIYLEPLARLAPGQPHYAAHRFQHLYMFFLYGFVIMKWWVIDDFLQIARGRVDNHTLRPPRGEEAKVFWGFKLVHGLWILVLPGLLLGWLHALAFYVVSQFVGGMILSLVFQLAHCVEEAEFYDAEAPGTLELDFARLQLATTVDFCPDNRLVGWYVGGLNFQAIHHLFPRISHVHYPALSPIVAEVCEEHGVEYKVQRSMWRLLGSHYRWLKRMGREDAVVAPNDEPAVAKAA